MHLQPVGSFKWQIKAAMVSSVNCNKVFTRKMWSKLFHLKCWKNKSSSEEQLILGVLHMPATSIRVFHVGFTCPHHWQSTAQLTHIIRTMTANTPVLSLSPRNQCNSLLWIGSCTGDPLEVSTQRNGLNWLRRKMSAVTLKEYACGGTLWKVWKHR